jgi:heme oxygenase
MKLDTSPVASERIHSILCNLYFPGLVRSSRLRSDLRALTGWQESDVEDHLNVVAESGRLGEFISHIKRSVDQNPHVVLAYAWVLYMAIFSGGRFIRATLEASGSAEFWASMSDTDSPGTDAASPPLDFFRFNTAEDGEDLKLEFKRRLIESGSLLTSRERAAVVKEAISIFDNMILLVTQLDVVCGTDLVDDDPAGLSSRVSAAGSRLRDSVAITKERRAASRGSQCPAAAAQAGDTDNHEADHDKSRAVRFQNRLPIPAGHDTPLNKQTGLSNDGAFDVAFGVDITSTVVMKPGKLPYIGSGLVWNLALLCSLIAVVLGLLHVQS